MFASEHEPLALLVELTPKLAKQAKMDRIKNWMRQETMDLFVYQLEHLSLAI